MTKDRQHVNPDLHVMVGVELKSDLMKHYPGHGELSKLVKNLLLATLAQIEGDIPVNAEQIARVTVDTERRRGLRGTKRPSQQETQ